MIGAFYDAYNALGFGFLEFVYCAALARELQKRGHTVEREVLVQVYYKGEPLVHQRMDLLVDRLTVVELKATESLPNHASRQLYNYLRATDLQDGLQLHFGKTPRFFRLTRG
jgi:GxxExxY protein